jgi:transposase
MLLATTAVLLGTAPAVMAASTERVSINSAEQQADGCSSEPAISGTGRYVAFHSCATNLAGTDANGSTEDVYVRDRVKGTTRRVSVGPSGVQGEFMSISPSISRDGRYVTFDTVSPLAPGDTNLKQDVYLRDLKTRSTVLERTARKSGRRCPYGGAEVSMAGSYSTDLRERVLAAMEAGETPEVAARRFTVGRSTAYRWAAAARDEGRRAAKRMGGGPKPKISGEVAAALLGVLGETNHLTLAECRDRLAERTGVRVHPWTVGRALRRCGWT